MDDSEQKEVKQQQRWRKITPSFWVCSFCCWLFPCLLMHLVMTDFWTHAVECRPCTQYSPNRTAQHQVVHVSCYLCAPGKHFSFYVSHSQPAPAAEKYCICFHILKVRNVEFFHRDFNFYCTKISLAAL